MTCVLYRKEHVKCGLIHPNGKLLALLTSFGTGTVELYRIDSANKPIKLMWSYQIKCAPHCLEWCNQDKSLCIGDSSGSIIVVDIDGTIRSRSDIHTKHNEVVLVRSMTINLDEISKDGVEIFPKYLTDLVRIEPYLLNLRDFASSDFFPGFIQSLENDQGRNALCCRDYLSRTTNNTREADDRVLSYEGNRESEGVVNATRERPRLIPEFSGTCKDVSIYISLDNNNNMMCSIGGHTPVWNYNISRVNDGRVNKILDVCLFKHHVVVVYKEIGDEINYNFEIVDLRRFLSSFKLVFSLFGYVQYLRQLLCYLKGVFRQIYTVWKAGIAPFRQFINSESKVKKNGLFSVIYSIVVGLPLNAFVSQGALAYDSGITIDQLAVVCQSVNDSVKYILFVISNTIYPAVEHMYVSWSVIKDSAVLRSTDDSCLLISKQMDGLQLYLQKITRGLEVVCPAVNVLIHAVSIVKTYMNESSPDSFEEIGFPRIISSKNSAILLSKFRMNEKDLGVLREFMLESEVGSEDSHSKATSERFFEYIEFRDMDSLLLDQSFSFVGSCSDSEREERGGDSLDFSLKNMGFMVDELYKFLVNHVTDNYILGNRLADLSIELNPNIFLNLGDIADKVSVSMADNGGVFFATFFGRFKRSRVAGDEKEQDVEGEKEREGILAEADAGQSVVVRVAVELGNDDTFGHSDLCGEEPNRGVSRNNPGSDMVVSCRSDTHTHSHSPLKTNFSVSASLISLPADFQRYRILDLVWVNHCEALMLVGNDTSFSCLLNFNLDLFSFCSVKPLGADTQGCSFRISSLKSEASFCHSPPSVFHHSKDVSRIYRPKKSLRRFLPSSSGKDSSDHADSGNSKCLLNDKAPVIEEGRDKEPLTSRSTKIVGFYSKDNTVSLLLSHKSRLWLSFCLHLISATNTRSNLPFASTDSFTP